MKTTDFAYYVGKYLNIYIPSQRAYSDKTCEEYERVFSIFLNFLDQDKQIKIMKFKLNDFTKEIVVEFMGHLKIKRGCCNKTINHRLAVLHSFCHYVVYESPKEIYNIQKILEIHYLKFEQKVMSYTTPEGIKLILNQIPLNTKTGMRDAALFSFMFDTGARVSEVCNIKPKNLKLNSQPIVIITGKGGKSRIVPLQESHVTLLSRYMNEFDLNLPENNEKPLFPNQFGGRITRQSVSRILKKYVDQARIKSPDLIPDKFSCHSVRHSTVMALLEANVDLIYIRDFLGHSSVKTTEIYLEISPSKKKEKTKGILDITPDGKTERKWKNSNVKKWLNSFE
jgi:site-specific recombinase XerD